MNYKAQLETFFSRFDKFFDEQVPTVIAESANEHYRERFTKKDWDGKPWPALSGGYRPKRGTMMVRSSALMNSIRPVTVRPSMVVMAAGSAKVPYAAVHNNGETIERAARSETFLRNRSTGGKGGRKGSFAKGTAAGRGYPFRSYKIRMPQRQFMGYSKELNGTIISRIKALYKIS